MSKTTVLYKDVAPGAAQNASVSGSGYSDDSNLSLIPIGTEPEPVITLEPNHWLLNGSFVFRETQKLAFWSTEMSNATGGFSDPPSITIDFSNQYSSTGITVVFDRASGEYCNLINIQWYQGDTLKADVDFEPDSTEYYCKQKVTSYDRVKITFKNTIIPLRYVKVEHIVFGVFRRFGMSELRSASVVNRMDGIVETLPISTFKWTLDSKEDVDFMFQLKQPVEIRNGLNLIGVYYIDGHERKTDRIYNIECYDAVGVLNEIPFDGGVYTNKSAKALLSEIVGSDFVIEYGDDVADINLTGILNSGTKRAAIQQVLFAWGVCLSTDGRETIKIFNLDTSLTEIGKDQTFIGASIKTDSIVTEVQVTAHAYTESSSGSIEIGGKKYTDTSTIYSVKNPDVTATDKQNVKKFQNGTLVSAANANAVAQRVYDWFLRRDTAKASVVWRGEALGDYVSFPNAWDGSNKGSITKMEIRLSNTVVAKCEAVGMGR